MNNQHLLAVALAKNILDNPRGVNIVESSIRLVFTLDYVPARFFFKTIMQSQREDIKTKIFNSKLVTKWIRINQEKLHYDIINDTEY